MDTLLLHITVLLCLAVIGRIFLTQQTSNNKKKNTSLKIVGGHEAFKNEYPPIVYLTLDNGRGQLSNLHCGASIVNKNYILTAGHCCDRQDPGSFLAIADVHNVSKPDASWQWRKISRFKRHPKFNLFTVGFDICVMRLNESFDLSRPYVQSSKFTKVEPPPGSDLTIFGWGRHNYEDTVNSLVLHTVSVTSVTFADCNQRNGGRVDKESQICANVPGKGPCQGDSGGPIIWRPDPGQDPVQVALVSWGNKCALADYPAVFANLAKMLDWILDVTKD